MLKSFALTLKNFLTHQESGQGMIEYGLIIALVIVVAIAGLIILGPSIATLIGSITSSV